jgi:5-methylcytosine-specific restriction endonuclease McrA
MRFHRRPALPSRVLAALDAWQRELDAELTAESARPATDRRTDGAIAEKHWTSHRQTKALEAVESTLSAMASPNVARCMYCEHDRGAEIDHAAPKSRNAARTFDWENHVWACGKCNRQKLERYDADMVIPTIHDPLKHLDLLPSGRWEPLEGDLRGRATVDTLPLLNHEELTKARQRWRRRLLGDLASLASQSPPLSDAIERFRDTATHDPFSDVFAALLALCALPNAAAFVSPAVLQFVSAHPEMQRWLPDADAQRLRDAEPEIAALASAIRPRAVGAKPAG